MEYTANEVKLARGRVEGAFYIARCVGVELAPSPWLSLYSLPGSIEVVGLRGRAKQWTAISGLCD